MNIAFWSNCRGNGCVTSNLAITGILSSMLYQQNILVWENHCHVNNLETMITGWRYNNIIRERDLYENQVGIDYLMKYCHSGYPGHRSVASMSERFLDDRLSYLSRSSLSPQLLDYNLSLVLPRMMRDISREFSRVYIDVGCEQSFTTTQILDEADLIVVNLPQDPTVVKHFMDNYGDLRNKSVYLFGNYFRKSKYTYRNLLSGYGIPGNRCGYIPHNLEFYDACASGKIIPFLTSHLDAGKEDETYLFFRGARMAVGMIERQIKRKENEIADKAERTD